MPERHRTLNLKKNLYGNKKKVDDGYTFDSISEWKRYKRLVHEVSIGNITELEVHPSFELSLGGDEKCIYSGDFSYLNKQNVLIVEDVKSPALYNSPALRLKLRMLKAQHNIKVILVHPSHVSSLAPHEEGNVGLPSAW